MPDKNNETKFSILDKFALWITKHVGTMGFFLIIFSWTLIWLTWNVLAPKDSRFDPFPGFILWLFISNMIQIFLMPLIMIGQNLQNKHAEIRAGIAFETNDRREKQIEIVINHLENQNQLILKMLKKQNHTH